ncbi:MAG TPA: amidase, partial [Actinomycetota bacterium]|nr:amidase [Actinomycetota bacterium]
ISRYFPEFETEIVRRADAVGRTEALGPLHGVPVAVKDLFDVAGWPTTGCSEAYARRVATADAEVVRRLREAGAVVIGKTNQHELAAGATNLVSACGPVRNPWDPGRIAGGSSGGSAAVVAARVVPLALGTDTGGSIRIPASLCGTAGLKPTWGAVPMEGAMPLAAALDSAGPLATTVEDIALAFSVLTGASLRLSDRLDGLRVAAVRLHTVPLRRDVAAACDALVDVLVAAGASRVEVASLDYEPELWSRIGWREFADAHGHLLEWPERLGRPTREFLDEGRSRSDDDYRDALEEASALRRGFLDRLRDADVLVAATTAFPAPAIDEPIVDVDGHELDVRKGAVSVLTRPVNLIGFPALALVSGFDADGLPLGAQLIGRAGEEELLLRAGLAFQRATAHHRRAPGFPATA